MAGFAVRFDAGFWLLLLALMFVTLVTTIESVSDVIAVQAVSWRRQRAVDFRAVQGAVNASALSNLLAGIAGVMPNSTYGGSCASLVELTGVGTRRVGACAGIVFIVLAFLPKVTALLVSIPSPVVAAYVMVLAALLFMQGVRIIVQDGLDYRKSIVAGLALLVGLGFETHVIFSDLISRDAMWGDLLSHGMVAGGVVAIALTLFMEFTSASRWRTELKLHAAGLPELDSFLLNVASRMRWDAAASERLRAAGEESLACLVQADGFHVEPAQAPAEQGNHARRLRVVARSDQGTVELEFIAAGGGRGISKTGSCGCRTGQMCRTNGNSRCACCAITRRPCVTGNTTTSTC